MRLRTTNELPCQAWTVTLSSLLIGLAGLTHVSVSIWLFLHTADFVPIIGDPLRNAFIGYMALGSFGFVTAVLGSCFAMIRNKTGLIIYGGFLVASMVCHAGLWIFVYLEERQVTMSEQLQRRIMRTSDTVGQVLNDKFLCRLESFNNEMEELEICGEIFSKWITTISSVLWGLSAVSICIEFVTLVMVVMLIKLIYEVVRRNKVEVFYDARVIDHSHSHSRDHQQTDHHNNASDGFKQSNSCSNGDQDNISIYDHLGHIEVNYHTDLDLDLQPVHQTTISL